MHTLIPTERYLLNVNDFESISDHSTLDVKIKLGVSPKARRTVHLQLKKKGKINIALIINSTPDLEQPRLKILVQKDVKSKDLEKLTAVC